MRRTQYVAVLERESDTEPEWYMKLFHKAKFIGELLFEVVIMFYLDMGLDVLNFKNMYDDGEGVCYSLLGAGFVISYIYGFVAMLTAPPGTLDGIDVSWVLLVGLLYPFQLHMFFLGFYCVLHMKKHPLLTLILYSEQIIERSIAIIIQPIYMAVSDFGSSQRYWALLSCLISFGGLAKTAAEYDMKSNGCEGVRGTIRGQVSVEFVAVFMCRFFDICARAASLGLFSIACPVLHFLFILLGEFILWFFAILLSGTDMTRAFKASVPCLLSYHNPLFERDNIASVPFPVYLLIRALSVAAMLTDAWVTHHGNFKEGHVHLQHQHDPLDVLKNNPDLSLLAAIGLLGILVMFPAVRCKSADTLHCYEASDWGERVFTPMEVKLRKNLTRTKNVEQPSERMLTNGDEAPADLEQSRKLLTSDDEVPAYIAAVERHLELYQEFYHATCVERGSGKERSSGKDKVKVLPDADFLNHLLFAFRNALTVDPTAEELCLCDDAPTELVSKVRKLLVKLCDEEAISQREAQRHCTITAQSVHWALVLSLMSSCSTPEEGNLAVDLLKLVRTYLRSDNLKAATCRKVKDLLSRSTPDGDPIVEMNVAKEAVRQLYMLGEDISALIHAAISPWVTAASLLWHLEAKAAEVNLNAQTLGKCCGLPPTMGCNWMASDDMRDKFFQASVTVEDDIWQEEEGTQVKKVSKGSTGIVKYIGNEGVAMLSVNSEDGDTEAEEVEVSKQDRAKLQVVRGQAAPHAYDTIGGLCVYVFLELRSDLDDAEKTPKPKEESWPVSRYFEAWEAQLLVSDFISLCDDFCVECNPSEGNGVGDLLYERFEHVIGKVRDAESEKPGSEFLQIFDDSGAFLVLQNCTIRDPSERHLSMILNLLDVIWFKVGQGTAVGCSFLSAVSDKFLAMIPELMSSEEKEIADTVMELCESFAQAESLAKKMITLVKDTLAFSKGQLSTNKARSTLISVVADLSHITWAAKLLRESDLAEQFIPYAMGTSKVDDYPLTRRFDSIVFLCNCLEGDLTPFPQLKYNNVVPYLVHYVGLIKNEEEIDFRPYQAINPTYALSTKSRGVAALKAAGVVDKLMEFIVEMIKELGHDEVYSAAKACDILLTLTSKDEAIATQLRDAKNKEFQEAIDSVRVEHQELFRKASALKMLWSKERVLMMDFAQRRKMS